MSRCAPGPNVLAEGRRGDGRLKTSNGSAGQRAAFDRWCADPEHAAAYTQTERLWEGIGGLAVNPELEALSVQALRATDPRRRQHRSGWHMPLALAASVAVCAVVLVFALGVFDRAPPPVVYATGPDQRDTVRLGDGSQLVLNADTNVAVRMGDNQRAIVLRSEEHTSELQSLMRISD